MPHESAHTQQVLTIVVPVGILALMLAFCLGLWLAGSRTDRSVVSGTDLEQTNDLSGNGIQDNEETSVTITTNTGGDADWTVDTEAVSDARIAFEKSRSSVPTPTDLLQALTVTPGMDWAMGEEVGGITPIASYSFGTLNVSGEQSWGGRPIQALVYKQEDVGTVTTTVYYTTVLTATGQVESYVVFADNLLVNTWGLLAQSEQRKVFPEETTNGTPIQVVRGFLRDLAVIKNESVVMKRADTNESIPLTRLGLGGFLSEDARDPNATLIGSIIAEGVPSEQVFLAPENGTKIPLGQAAQGAFYSVRPDGHLVFYDAVIPFWKSPVDDRTGVLIGGSSQPIIQWKDKGSKDATYYKTKLGGCGSGALVNTVDPEKWAPYLSPIGTANNGESVYGFEYLIRLTNAISELDDLKMDYDMWRSTNADKGLKEFYAMRPLFVYKDAFGRWVKFTHSDIIPAAECGKPVIYLYPPKTTDVTVRVQPQGGFSKVEPAYNDGWRVVAHPDGRLVNKDDGKTYPYLFWEGRGGYYQAPERYWVVAKADVEVFLDNTLAKLGLNTKEIADFKEFWVPKMQADPYYKIGFHGNAVMNDLAPLSIQGASPDTMIRVLMDYEPLQKPVASQPPTLRTPKRQGFTVVEWGGVLR